MKKGMLQNWQGKGSAFRNRWLWVRWEWSRCRRVIMVWSGRERPKCNHGFLNDLTARKCRLLLDRLSQDWVVVIANHTFHRPAVLAHANSELSYKQLRNPQSVPYLFQPKTHQTSRFMPESSLTRTFKTHQLKVLLLLQSGVAWYRFVRNFM